MYACLVYSVKGNMYLSPREIDSTFKPQLNGQPEFVGLGLQTL